MTPSIGKPINTKLGPGIYSWSIPARDTCPGKSTLCSSRCYAARGFFRMPGVSKSHVANEEFSRTDKFVGWMSDSLQSRVCRVMRVHVAGDFYDEEYVRKWHAIAERNRRTLFFLYTRSWRDESIFPALVSLSTLTNIVMWFSMDRETGPAPLVPGVRLAYMAINDVDASKAPPADLVFRDNYMTAMKRANGNLVCPAENGVTGRLRHTCTTCGVCWNKQQHPSWEKLLFNFDGMSSDGTPIDVYQEDTCSS